ncbi:unnamed protein product [Symbiodinium natans]|uniref:Uncharacterized protein n=1 Tax=Symbiodinium natans TaxID=878477 RepID=A0A812MUL6_9DINO|nr:unnamed protein product [Symbiodinium natans]
MSAAKFEKSLAALERRMREEMKMEVASLAQRVYDLEEELRQGGRSATKEVQIIPTQEEILLPGTAFSDVLPEKEDTPKGKDATPDGQWMMEAANDRRMRVRPTIVEPEVEEEDDEEPIPFAETVWNVALVLGFTGAGWVDIILALILALTSTFMQILFVLVLLSPSFLGEPFESEIAVARSWRANIAHDSKYKDLAETSLASRVCNGDGSLIQSTVQANLLREIDGYLGISALAPFEPSNLQPGTILSGLCILLWCIYLCREFRAIWVSIEAALQIPRAHVTIFKTGRFVTITWRRLGVYLTLRLARTVVATCLLYAGMQWLARTTNIADLILNAVALGAILEIDEMIFASLLPKKIQVAIYELEAINVKYSRTKSQLEGFFIFVMVFVLALTPLLLWVMPLQQAMIAVKKEYCEHNQDFVMAFNEEQQLPIGVRTVPFANLSDSFSLGELAVGEHAKGNLANMSVAKYISFAADTDRAVRLKPLAKLCMQYLLV